MTAIPCLPPARSPGSTGTRESGADPDLWLYRERTIGMLRRYQRLSVEVGRPAIPSGTGILSHASDLVSRRYV